MTTPYDTPQTTSSSDPDAIRREIERTQRRLGGDVDALTEKVTPSRIMERRVGRVRSRVAGWRDAVMGSDSDDHPSGARGLASQASDRLDDVTSTASDTASDAASRVADTTRDLPDAARRQTRGNPLAAGLIAFGAGWLVSSLLPATRQEQELAGQVKDKALEAGQPLVEQAQEKAQELGESLREPAQAAVQSVQETAQDAVSTVQDEGRSAADQVQDRAQQAGSTVKDEATGR
ncbi:hypothetical protein PSU4_48060 [Pseudonocardia sulfidoxydans NBRC 16205]|uniref:DUF3618 domain-containing protein n=1 Tax=Pseudonocardia sulfidoxydans NBRC 16205 TaxID=1223511 RepID=A0A511DM12_9PSEU|nr:DUF3618 domain-containing protein [Pseudonocardia sulfidoxydans]GEL25852.1 hypothetical protein PSU4_48060 [Pseudonocardia sulfidoxydans NBRC 16205]